MAEAVAPRRRPGRGSKLFSLADQAAVVMALAKGATVAAAAKAAGFAVQTLYNRRRRCARFRAAWDGAVAESARPILVEPGPGRAWQVKRMRRNRFTRERKAVFLTHFAASCDVRASAAEAGMCVWTVYDHRRRDPAFAAAWREAEKAGCALLEAEALRQRIEAMEAIDFPIGAIPDPDARRDSDLEFWRTMHLLREHKRSLAGIGKPGRRPRVASNAEVREALTKRLKAFRIRVRSREAGGKSNSRHGTIVP